MDDSGRLWVYDTDIQKIYPACTKKAGAIRDLYALELEDGTTDFSTIEDGFNTEFESAAAPAIEKLHAHEYLSDDMAFAFVRFVAAQLCRTPAFFGRISDIITPSLKEMCRRIWRCEPGFQDNLAKTLSDSGATTENIAAMFEEIEKGEIQIGPAHGFVMVKALHLIETVTEQLCKMQWSFHRVPDGDVDLIIGDHPVTFYDDGPDDGEIRHLAFSNPNLEIMLPLGNRLVACARHDGPTSYGELMPGSVMACNLRTLYHAKRYVYASIECQPLMDVALKEKGTGPKVHTREIRLDGKLVMIHEYY